MSTTKKVSAPPPAPNIVWQEDQPFTGYYVTEPAPLYLPIATVSPGRRFKAKSAKKLARRIAKDPSLAGCSKHCEDLRDVGRLDSTKRVPDWIYHLRAFDVDDEEANEMRFDLFCQVRWDAMQARRMLLLIQRDRVWPVGEMMSDSNIHPYPWTTKLHEQGKLKVTIPRTKAPGRTKARAGR